MRHKPWADDYLAENAHIALANPEQYKGKWHELFGNDHPIHIEVGTGKGSFIAGMGKLHPEMNYIGIELFKSVIVTAVDKIKRNRCRKRKASKHQRRDTDRCLCGK